ncbi:HSF-type DNA-binding-domain-containing protein, partial [Melampsora americana]
IKTSKQNKRQSKTFVCKLYEILQTSSIQSNPLISWSSLGERFYVNNPIEFSKLILPLYFKHNNWPSFIRQLNMYGFHKVHHSSTSDHPWEFRHPNFRKGRSDLISLIQRK